MIQLALRWLPHADYVIEDVQRSAEENIDAKQLKTLTANTVAISTEENNPDRNSFEKLTAVCEDKVGQVRRMISGFQRIINFIDQMKYIASSYLATYLITNDNNTLIRLVPSINTENVQRNAEENADEKELMTLTADIDFNPFEELFIDTDIRMKGLDKIVSALEVVKSKKKQRKSVH